ncbi:glycosyltransferase family 25 protein [Psychrobacter sp. GP33]|uniref:glycosyltransferase family 25 protein n=1 Tax=Psychrobacter sp. GP33 TaxID=2758709 RepID=UPI0015FB7070|nr:glycosyltransferase family 25 protein [Psychrobacter sp. GP33]
MKKLIISLENAHDRRQHIKEQFESNNISYEFFDAVNATQIDTVAKKLNIPITNTRLGTNEIACFLSHASIWQLAVENNYPYVCVFEDDVYLGENAEFYLNNILEWKPDDAHILKLEVYNKDIKVNGRFKSLKVGDRKLVKLATKHTGCAGYVITLETAHILLDIVRNYEGLIPVDHIVFGDFLHNYDANIYQILPAICIQSQHYKHAKSLISYLEHERNDRYGMPKNNKKFMDKVVREGKRLIKQPINIIERINLRLKGIKELRLTFR